MMNRVPNIEDLRTTKIRDARPKKGVGPAREGKPIEDLFWGARGHDPDEPVPNRTPPMGATNRWRDIFRVLGVVKRAWEYPGLTQEFAPDPLNAGRAWAALQTSGLNDVDLRRVVDKAGALLATAPTRADLLALCNLTSAPYTTEGRYLVFRLIQKIHDDWELRDTDCK